MIRPQRETKDLAFSSNDTIHSQTIEQKNHISGIGQFVFRTTTPIVQVLSAADMYQCPPTDALAI